MVERNRSGFFAPCLILALSHCGESKDASKADASSEVDASPSLEADSDAGRDAGMTSTLPTEYILSSMDSVPEGVTFDPQERAFYAGSLNGGSITKVAADGAESLFRAADGSALTGLKIDATRRRLWACANDTIWVFDLGNGSRSHEFPLSAAADGARCNDLALDAQGRAYITDASHPNIYTVDVSDGAATVFATNPAFQAGSLGLNGIALSKDSSALLVGIFVRSQLFRVSLTNPTDITEVTLSGAAFSNPDGLVMLDGALYAVSSNDVKKVVFDDATNLKGKVTVQPYAEGGLSTGTGAEGELYAIKSDTIGHITKQPLNLPFKIVRIDRSKFK